jgi:hypothetical protein
MNQSNPTKLKATYSLRSEFIKSFNSKCCKWGIRVPNTKTRGTLGSPAPLWMNTSQTKYRLCYIISLISSLLYIVFYIVLVVYNASVQSSSTSSTSSSDSTNTNSTSSSDSTTTNTTETSILNADCLATVQTQVSPIIIIIGSTILFVNGKYSII